MQSLRPVPNTSESPTATPTQHHPPPRPCMAAGLSTPPPKSYGTGADSWCHPFGTSTLGHPHVPCHPRLCPPPATFRPPQGEMSLSSQPRRRRAQSWDREQRDGKSHRTMSSRAGKGGGGVRVSPPPSSEPPESPTNLSHSSGPTASGLPAPSQTQAQGHQGPSVSPLLGGGGNTTQAYFPPPPVLSGHPTAPPPSSCPPNLSRPKGRAAGDNPRFGDGGLATSGTRCPRVPPPIRGSAKLLVPPNPGGGDGGHTGGGTGHGGGGGVIPEWTASPRCRWHDRTRHHRRACPGPPGTNPKLVGAFFLRLVSLNGWS